MGGRFIIHPSKPRVDTLLEADHTPRVALNDAPMPGNVVGDPLTCLHLKR